MSLQDADVVRVFSNNALLVRLGDVERVVVGRGIGFGRRIGETLALSGDERHYVEANPERIQLLDSIGSLDPDLLQTVSSAVDLAGDLLGELHPSVYVLLVDHLVFALQRHREGQEIRNGLLPEIQAVFVAEFAAAELIVHFVNARLGLDLPLDEAAFIALHLNAARTGGTVKRPLERVNSLGGLVRFAEDLVGATPDGEFIQYLYELDQRVQSGRCRSNAAQRPIEVALPHEAQLARRIVARTIGGVTIPAACAGEVSYLAVFLHGWQQTTTTATSSRKREGLTS
ncbi:MAG: PRD domain-containing protein [Propionibacteriaceae bacterium]|nr:PRD domain-containing protein [Propionibacteriaceae bacterium]